MLGGFCYNIRAMKYSLIALLIIFLGFGYLNLDKNQSLSEIKQIEINDVVINVEVADTDAERAQGLSGRESLKEGEGLLFIFEKEGFYGFWMKDMNFPIDIAWINKDKKIIHIENGVSPETYPKVFQPTEKSLYVLEVPAGFFAGHNINLGSFVRRDDDH